MTDRVGSGRAGLVLAIAVALLVLLAVVAGVLAATRPAPQLTAGSPEATVQDYLQHVHAHELEDAAALLSAESGCTVTHLEDAYVDRGARIVLRDTRVEGDTARVRVDLVHDEGGLFGGGGWTSEETFELVRDGDRWAVSGTPWPMGFCGADEGNAP